MVICEGNRGIGYGYVEWLEAGSSEELALGGSRVGSCLFGSRGRLGEVDWKKLSRVRFFDMMPKLPVTIQLP